MTVMFYFFGQQTHLPQVDGSEVSSHCYQPPMETAIERKVIASKKCLFISVIIGI